jgi:hypothetical protein
MPAIDPIPMRMQDLMSMSSSTKMCGSHGVPLNAEVIRVICSVLAITDAREIMMALDSSSEVSLFLAYPNLLSEV